MLPLKSYSIVLPSVFSGMLYGPTVPPPQASVEMLTSPRSNTGGSYMEIANQAYDHGPHSSVPVCREDIIPGGNYAGYYPSKNRTYIGPCY